MSKEILTIRCDSEIISPLEYLNLSEKEKMNIQKTKIVPPKLGNKNFGGIEIFYKYPIFKAKK